MKPESLPTVVVRPLAAKFFVDAAGKYVGAFAGVEKVYAENGKVNGHPVKAGDVISTEQPLPDDPAAVEVPTAPKDGRQEWSGTAWGEVPPLPPDFRADLDALAGTDASVDDVIAVLRKHLTRA